MIDLKYGKVSTVSRILILKSRNVTATWQFHIVITRNMINELKSNTTNLKDVIIDNIY